MIPFKKVGPTAAAVVVALGLLGSAPAHALTYSSNGCPDISGLTGPNGFTSSTTDCNLVITFGLGGSITTTGPGGFYDVSEDSLIGVVNNSGHSITSFNLDGGLLDIFGFDGDGINAYTGMTNAAAGMSSVSGADDYGGEQAYFTNVIGNTGTVNFLNGIANNSTGYFSLENEISLAQAPRVTIPEPGTLALFGIGLGALGWKRRRGKG